MNSIVSSYLSSVYNLNNSTANKSTSPKEGKHVGTSADQIRDVVEITSKIYGSTFNKKEIQTGGPQKAPVLQKTDIQNSGERSEANTRLKTDGEGRKESSIETVAHLTEKDKKALEALQSRDREVRQHEHAHIAAAGKYANGMSLTTKIGPDGRHYAVGGEVSIDMSEVPGDPEATIAKAQAIRRAANAPANPSSQDRLVAADATRMEASARLEIIKSEKEAGGKEPALNDNKMVEKVMKDDYSSEVIHQANQTTIRAASAYGSRENEIGRVINRVV